MTHQLIEQTLSQLAKASYPIQAEKIRTNFTIPPDKFAFHDFVDTLIDQSHHNSMVLISNAIDKTTLQDLLKRLEYPLLVFEYKSQTEYYPLLILPFGDRGFEAVRITPTGTIEAAWSANNFDNLYAHQDSPDNKRNNKILVITAFPSESMFSSANLDSDSKANTLTPFKRLLRLLRNEKKDIGYIYVYALVIGVINLSLPLGIQAIISRISGGMMFNAVVLLICMVVLGILVAGALQIMQITLVEVLQQRVFAKAAFEFAYRIPRFKTEALSKYYPPELINRFFDILTVQKGLPKLLIEITAACLQIFFGVLLLSFYHPFFVFFGILLLFLLYLIFRFTGTKGLETSLLESKYKYKVVHWLEEMARTLSSFKMAGHTNLPMQRTDEYVSSYLYYRKSHFNVLATQFAHIIAFKTTITGGLLVLGALLVVDRQITLGQFVASEIVIITIVNAVEKIIVSMETIYDLLTAVEKIGQVTDLPIERDNGLQFMHLHNEGAKVEVKNLKYKYADAKNYTLKGLTFSVEAGQTVCLAGDNGSGKTSLINVLTGILPDYEGVATLNGLSIRDIKLPSLRHYIAKHISRDEIFDGTILDNITLGRLDISLPNVLEAIDKVGLSDTVNSLPEGLSTPLLAEGRRISGSVLHKILLARCIASRPKLLLMEDFMPLIAKEERLKIMAYLQDRNNGWTLICITNNPLWLASADKIIVMKEGEAVAQGNYEEVKAFLE